MEIKLQTDSTMQFIAVKDANNFIIYNYITLAYYNTH